MFSMCSELTPRAPIPDGRMAQFMQPWHEYDSITITHTFLQQGVLQWSGWMVSWLVEHMLLEKLHFLSKVHFLSMKRFNLGSQRAYKRERCSALVGKLASGTDGSGVNLQLILLLRLALTFFTAKHAIWKWPINYLTFLFVTIVWCELATASSSSQTYSYFLDALASLDLKLSVGD